MPEKILGLLELGTLTEEQIAELLLLTLSEVRSCIEYLHQTGYIKYTLIPSGTTSCSSHCDGCGKCSGNCSHHHDTDTFIRVWELV